MHFSALFPQVCASVAFVLSILCVLAGYKPGFMENHHIIMLNTSTLGYKAIPVIAAPSDSTLPSFGSTFEDLSSELNGAIGDAVDKLSGELGIKQWYSMHLMSMCEGTYTPDATVSGARLNVSFCTRPIAMYHFDISNQLDKELQVGNLHLDLSDIGWPLEIQDGLSSLNSLLSTLFVLYIVGIATTSLTFLTAPFTLFQRSPQLRIFYRWLPPLSFLSLLAASIIITYVQFKAVDFINTYGNNIGVYASRGDKYMVFTWMAVLVLFLSIVVELFGEKLVNWNIPSVWSVGPDRLHFKPGS